MKTTYQNPAVKLFDAKIFQIVSEQRKSVKNDVLKAIESLKEIELTTFGNNSPYRGEFKNKIFFTKLNCYRNNSATNMSVGNLIHPNRFFEDRGYIKGVATDLDGYLKLRSAKNITHNFRNVAQIYFPKFKKSKHIGEYINLCNEFVNQGAAELDRAVDNGIKQINEFLKEKTGCSLLFYLKSI